MKSQFSLVVLASVAVAVAVAFGLGRWSVAMPEATITDRFENSQNVVSGSSSTVADVEVHQKYSAVQPQTPVTASEKAKREFIDEVKTTAEWSSVHEVLNAGGDAAAAVQAAEVVFPGLYQFESKDQYKFLLSQGAPSIEELAWMQANSLSTIVQRFSTVNGGKPIPTHAPLTQQYATLVMFKLIQETATGGVINQQRLSSMVTDYQLLPAVSTALAKSSLLLSGHYGRTGVGGDSSEAAKITAAVEIYLGGDRRKDLKALIGASQKGNGYGSSGVQVAEAITSSLAMQCMSQERCVVSETPFEAH